MTTRIYEIPLGSHYERWQSLLDGTEEGETGLYFPLLDKVGLEIHVSYHHIIVTVLKGKDTLEVMDFFTDILLSSYEIDDPVREDDLYRIDLVREIAP